MRQCDVFCDSREPESSWSSAQLARHWTCAKRTMRAEKSVSGSSFRAHSPCVRRQIFRQLGCRACKPSFIRRYLPSFELLDLQKTKRTLLRVSGHKKCLIWRCADATKMVGNDQGCFCYSSDSKVGIDVKSAIIQPVQYSNSVVLHNHLRCPPLNSYKCPAPSKYHT
jgi:hypothetical protein